MKSTQNREGLISRFSAEVTSVGGLFALVPNFAAVRDYVTKLALASGVKRIVLCGDMLSSELFPAGVAPGPFEVASRANMSREKFLAFLKTAEIGVSPADLAVAETGTLIITTSDESDRLVTALPKIHVAVLPRSRLVFALQDAEQHVSQTLKEKRGGVAVSLVSATSRTSDIGDMVILGVHGPKELHVLLLDQELA